MMQSTPRSSSIRSGSKDLKIFAGIDARKAVGMRVWRTHTLGPSKIDPGYSEKLRAISAAESAILSAFPRKNVRLWYRTRNDVKTTAASSEKKRKRAIFGKVSGRF